MYLCKSLSLLESYLIEKGIISPIEKWKVFKAYEDDLGIYGRCLFFLNGAMIKITRFKNNEAFIVTIK